MSSGDLNRRSFIRWVISAGALSACPWPMSATGKEAPNPAPTPQSLGGDTFSVCHQVRDGAEFPRPEPSKTVDVIIIGAGPSGLAAADHVQSADFLLLEKETHVGGNAYTETWNGLRYSTGAAFTGIFDPEHKSLYEKWGFELKKIKGRDPACFNGHWIPDFWSGKENNPAFEHLPYAQSVKKDFRAFCREIAGIDLEKNREKLDALAFSEILKKYAPPLKAYWDTFGPSNWGAVSENTSAYLGIEAARDWEMDQRLTFEGGLGVGSQKIYDHLSASAQKKVILGATVYNLHRVSDKKVLVYYLTNGEPACVAARSVVMAAPKYIARRLLSADLPPEQSAAMGSIRYCPYLVYNLCFDRVVYNQGYDNWIVGAKKFTDFITADWVTHADGGDLKRPQILTVYAPRPEVERPELLDDELVLENAQAAVQELGVHFPSWQDHLKEVRIFRRGHPMFMATPNLVTRVQPLAGRDFSPIYFAHSDNHGSVSEFGDAVVNGIDAAKKATKHFI